MAIKPVVLFIGTFDCVAHVNYTGGHQRKLDDKGTPMMFIRYEVGTKA